MIDAETGIWMDTDQKHWNDGDLAARIATYVSGKTVYDFGCGNGFYVSYFRSSGIDCLGFDGYPKTQELTSGMCGVLDLSKKIDLPKRDWVISLEVGEHIPVDKEAVFISNLTRHCREGVIVSWAIPGQGGEGHVNERSNEYIIDRFIERGFSEATFRSRELRQSSKLKWFANTLMMFYPRGASDE